MGRPLASSNASWFVAICFDAICFDAIWFVAIGAAAALATLGSASR